jgi:coproporphyrinogen III oxidase-like Fe-S oxidoreductase
VQLKGPKADRYFAALRREIRACKDAGFVFGDVYVGGGTPTILPDELRETLQLIRTLFPIERISVETNPDHLSSSRLSDLLEMGVNRLSVGVQSFDDQLLKAMGRYDRYGSGADILARLQDASEMFDTLNVDMIFNQPRQTMESLKRDIEILTCNTFADQVSFYPLMPATTTSKAMCKQMGALSFRNERRYYERILAGMQPVYRPATAWCFARKRGLIDEYIVDHEEYVGLGSGAFSYVDGVFYSSSFSIDRYLDRIEHGRSGIVMGRRLSELEQLRYRFLVSLFGLDLDWEQLRSEYTRSFMGPLRKELLFFSLIGAIRKDGTHYHLTEKGMYYWVVLMREFLTGVNNVRDEMRAHIRIERSRSRAGQNENVLDDVA